MEQQGIGFDKNGVFVEIGKRVRMWVGPDQHKREGKVILVCGGQTTMVEDGTGHLFGRPTEEVEIISPEFP